MVKNKVARALLQQCEEVSQMLKSLAHPIRLKILCFLMNGEKSVNELTEFCGISQSAMSQFLNRMRKEKVIASRKEGTFVYYTISNPKVDRILKAIKESYY